MNSGDEECGPNSGGRSTGEGETENGEKREASEQDGSSEEKETENMISKENSREGELKETTAKAKRRGRSSAEEGGTRDEEMSEGSEPDAGSDEKETDDVKSNKKSEKQESKKPTNMAPAKKAKKRGGSSNEEDEILDEMTGGSGQDGGWDLKEMDNGKSNNESGVQEIKKQTSTKKAKEKKVKKMKKKGKTGVVYLSRIPPHMKPLKLRHLLSQYGEVSRVYLAPEDNSARIQRKRAGGNSGKNFVEGWVEFVHKRDAKRIAAFLNGEAVDPRKRSAYHYDLWTIKYLKKFKWDNLTAEIAYKKAVREQKIAAEVSAAKKERDFYLAKVDEARAISSMEERKQKRKKPEGNESSAAGERPDDGSAKKPRFVRSFHQRKSVLDPALETKSRLAADVLAGVFGKSTVR